MLAPLLPPLLPLQAGRVMREAGLHQERKVLVQETKTGMMLVDFYL